MKAIHFLCHHNGTRPKNSVSVPPKGSGRFRLGWWALSKEEAQSLIGGFAYLHETSSQVSYSESLIQDFTPGDGEWAGLIALDLARRPDVGHWKWRGKKAGQNPRDNFRIVEHADFPHEKNLA